MSSYGDLKFVMRKSMRHNKTVDICVNEAQFGEH